MKLMTKVAVRRVLCEGITDFDSLADFDKESLKALSKNCMQDIAKVNADPNTCVEAEPAVKGTCISTTTAIRLVIACNAVKYYRLIGRTLDSENMSYRNVFSDFKVDYKNYEQLKKQDAPKVPVVKESDGEKKIINWVPAFKDCMSRIFGLQGPLSYVLRKESTVPSEIDDPLNGNDYFGMSGGLVQEMTARIPHTGPLYKSDSKTVYLHIVEACRGTACASAVKTYNTRKGGRATYFALIDHHAGEEKYRSIAKKCQTQLMNTKWNGKVFSMENHVSNHRQSFEHLVDCAEHVTTTIPSSDQRVQYLVDSIEWVDHGIHAAIGLIRNDVNDMFSNFEKAASNLIGVDPYVIDRRGPKISTANISALDYKAGSGGNGVDLRWH